MEKSTSVNADSALKVTKLKTSPCFRANILRIRLTHGCSTELLKYHQNETTARSHSLDVFKNRVKQILTTITKKIEINFSEILLMPQKGAGLREQGGFRLELFISGQQPMCILV